VTGALDLGRGPEVVEAGPADVAAVVEVVEAAYRDPDRPGWTTEAHLVAGRRTDAGEVAADLADPAVSLLVIREGGRVVGCCRVVHHGPVADLGLLAVAPERQAGGLGRALVAEGERRAADRGAEWVLLHLLEGRPEILAWYGRLGYRPTGEHARFPEGDGRRLRRPGLRFVVLDKALGGG
jgi:predicted N-acetyltransferase YhbS